MSNQTKNPIFWSAVAFLAGMGLAAWGWDKYESTIAARTTGSVTMIIVGCVLVIGGLVGFFTAGNSKR